MSTKSIRLRRLTRFLRGGKEQEEWGEWEYSAKNGLIISCFAVARESSISPWWCGYCLLPSGCALDTEATIGSSRIEVHGGITYKHTEGGQTTIGFDTAHAGDEAFGWDLAKVKQETEHMAEQIASMTSLLVYLAAEGGQDEEGGQNDKA